VKKWCATFERVGMNGLPMKRSRKLSEKSQASIREKKERLIKIIHERPNAYGINRASWSLQALSEGIREDVQRVRVTEFDIGVFHCCWLQV
jgi:hypothetical protein